MFKSSFEDLPLMFDYWREGKDALKKRNRKTSGRNWRVLIFLAYQLRVVYDLFDNKIVDKYLNGELDQENQIYIVA